MVPFSTAAVTSKQKIELFQLSLTSYEIFALAVFCKKCGAKLRFTGVSMVNNCYGLD